MKRPSVFRRSVNSTIPNLCESALAASSSSPRTEDVILVEPVYQLYRYMKSMKLGYGIISSFDLTFLVQRTEDEDNGETLLISEGIPNTSASFVGALVYMVDTAIKDNKDWKIPDMKHAPGGSSQAYGPGSSQSQGSQGGSKGGGEKKRSPHQGLHSMTTWSQADWKETPAELLHLARDHFAEGWSGRIVRGTYEGQRIIVKLAPTGSDRAKALLTEVLAYHKLKEYWGKYVPKLVSHGTTAGGKVMYIGTEEIDSREIGMEVVKEAFDALTAVHGSGVLHGDIHPSNILVAKGQQAGVYLIDFGFARFIPSSEDCMREQTRLECLLNELSC